MHPFVHLAGDRPCIAPAAGAHLKTLLWDHSQEASGEIPERPELRLTRRELRGRISVGAPVKSACYCG